MSVVTRARRSVLRACSALSLIGLALIPAPAQADGPGTGTPWVASVGDSYISGEAGRWAGSSNSSSASADALGSTAYFDNAANNAETIERCHRSKSAEIGIGGGVNSFNLACSGAKTATDAGGTYFKPGLDFYDNGAGKIGQARRCSSSRRPTTSRWSRSRSAATTSTSPTSSSRASSTSWAPRRWWKDYCNDDSSVTANFTSANVAAVKTRIANAFINVRTAMRNAGYADSAWTLLVQNYPSPIPNGSASATAKAATPARTPAAAASGTTTPTGPTPRRCRPSTMRSPARSPSRA